MPSSPDMYGQPLGLLQAVALHGLKQQSPTALVYCTPAPSCLARPFICFKPLHHMAGNHEPDCSGVLRVQVRSLQLGEVPLTSLTAIVASGAEQGHTPAVLLAGSYDSHVYAYAPGPGRQLGAFPGHSDAVSCLHLWGSDQLLTASWDCSIKLWRWVPGSTACCAGVMMSDICCAGSCTPEVVWAPPAGICSLLLSP